VSPPQEHSITPSHDWSERYQPVSYSIAKSRSGTGAEFTDMVNRCKAAGVGIIVDAVINHMTNSPSPGVGSNGTAYTKYEYPGLYTQSDFHPACQVNNYQSAANVQDCELLSLPDLNTGSPSVRQKIADYLLMLARLGVVGFRIDAAKHIQQVELDDIIALVNTTLAGEGKPRPYFVLEVIGGAGRRWRHGTTMARATPPAAPPTSPNSPLSGWATSSGASTASTSPSSTPTGPRETSFPREPGG
jgi:alpha-amylase